MSRGHDGADTGFALGDCREGNACSHHSFFEQLAAELHRQASLADDDGGNRRLARRRIFSADVETESAQLLLEEAGILPKFVDQLRFLFENIEGGDTRRGDRWRMRG